MELYFPDDVRLDYAWVTPRLAVGTTIASTRNMWRLAADRVTHVLGLESDFDDNTIAANTGIIVRWLPQPDDLRPKPPEWFEQGVSFVEDALRKEGSRVYVHCLAGIQRSPLMVLACLGATDMELVEAMNTIKSVRPGVNFPMPYVLSVQQFLKDRKRSS